MDDQIRDLARAARAEVEHGLDVDADRAAVAARTAVSAWSPEPGRPERRGSLAVWVATAAAVCVGTVGLAVLVRPNGSPVLQTTATTILTSTVPTAPATIVVEPVAPTTATTTTVLATTTAATTTTTTTTVAPVVGLSVRPGSIELAEDDLIARSVDGDVRWYPGALGTEPGEPVLLIDRPDPRPVPEEGEGPNIIDQVAGTFDGALVYSDCCEPVSGNLLAITEPGAEADLWASPDGTSELAQVWGVGFDPQLEPGGTRVLAYNFDFVNLVDAATGEQWYGSPTGSFAGPGNFTGSPFNALDATWLPGGRIGVVGWSAEDGVIVTEHRADDITTEVRRLGLASSFDRSAAMSWVEVVGVADGVLTIGVSDADGLRLLDVDIATWQVVETDQRFAVPGDADLVRLSPDGRVMAWIVDGVVSLQRTGEEPFVWGDGIDEVWFPTISVSGRG